MIDNGYIFLHRKLLKSPEWKFSTPEQKSVLIVILLFANYEANKWEWNGNEFDVKPGQFVTSLDSIRKAAGIGISQQNVRTALKRFEKLGFLTNESTNRGRLISITKWDDYQIIPGLPNKLNNKPLTSPSQAPNKPLTPIKEVKKDNKEKKIPPYSPPRGIDLKSNGYNWIDADAWDSFVEHRRSIKKPLTKKAAQLNLNFLKENRADHKQIIETAIMNRWQGLFPLKETKPGEKGAYTSEDAHKRYKDYMRMVNG